MSTLSVKLRLLIGAVIFAGVAVVAGAAASWDSEDALFLGAVVAIIAVSELWDFAPVANARVSVSIGLILAAGTFSGLPGMAVAAAAVGGFDFLLHRKPAFKAAFNLGVLLITGAVFVGVLEAFEGNRAEGDWLVLVGPAVLGAICAFAVNSGLVSLAISIDKGEGVLAVWDSRFRWMLPYYAILGVIAVFLAASYDRWELGGFALLLAPLAMAWLAIRQHIDNATRSALRPS